MIRFIFFEFQEANGMNASWSLANAMRCFSCFESFSHHSLGKILSISKQIQLLLLYETFIKEIKCFCFLLLSFFKRMSHWQRICRKPQRNGNTTKTRFGIKVDERQQIRGDIYRLEAGDFMKCLLHLQRVCFCLGDTRCCGWDTKVPHCLSQLDLTWLVKLRHCERQMAAARGGAARGWAFGGGDVALCGYGGK